MGKLRLIFSKQLFIILYKKIQLQRIYKNYAVHNTFIHEDIETRFLIRGCLAKDTTIKTKFIDNVVIGAGSVVVKSFPLNCVIAGNPA